MGLEDKLHRAIAFLKPSVALEVPIYLASAFMMSPLAYFADYIWDNKLYASAPVVIPIILECSMFRLMEAGKFGSDAENKMKTLKGIQD